MENYELSDVEFFVEANSFEQSVLKVKSLSKQQSHMLSNLMQANCLVRIPAGKIMLEGQIVHGVFID